MHKLSRTIAVMGLLAPLGANALGVGDIRLHSALNQSLNAEIPLVLSGSDSLNDIRVSLAGPEVFAKAGLERQYFLTKLQFNTVQKPDGSYAIQVSSREVMHEPFLSFLVEVNWPQGRVLREFTVLLDPPATLSEETFSETARPSMAFTARRYEPVAEISRAGEASRGRRQHRRAAGTAAQPALASPALIAPPSEGQLTGETYGPVRRDETLWNIAKSLAKEASVNQEQMLLALFKANPQAFLGNVNTLKAGSVLRIPTQDYIAQLSPQTARGESARRRSAGAGGEEAATPEGQLKLLAPAEARSKGEGAAAGSEARAAKAKGELALEVAETVKQENEEFRSRLSQLEQKLGELQRLIVLKNEQIATLQSQQGAPRQPTTAPPQPASTVPAPPPAATPAGPAVPAVSPPAAQEPPTTQQPPVTPTPAAKPPVTATPAQQPPTVPQPVRKPAVSPPPEEPGFSIEPAYLGAGVGVAAMGVLAWLIRRRRNAMIAQTESILLAAERESLQKAYSSASKPSESRLEPVMAPKSSFLSEFTPSDFDALGTETDEVDPIAEADVYLAYGRYRQAEELIRHAITQHPDRDECKLKLLEIYSATENRSAFEDYVSGLKQTYKEAKPEFWAKIDDMARELAPAGSMFQSSGSVSQPTRKKGAGGAKSAGGPGLSDDLIDDLKRFEIEFSEPAADDSELFLSLDSDTGEKGVEKEELKEEFAPLAFDFKAADSGKAQSLNKDEPRDTQPEPDNLIAFEPNIRARQEKSPPQRADKTIDDILRELTSNIANEAAEQPTAKSQATPADSASGPTGLKLDLVDTGADEELEITEAPEDVVTELTDMDQFETKLDLAKAYADMEDEESAREILQDVAANGNDKQKSEARALLNKLGAAPAELTVQGPRSGRM